MDRESSQESLEHAPSNEVLVKINESFDQSKTGQILRLIGDQGNLTRRFQQCDFDNECDSEGCDERDSNSDNRSVEEIERKLTLRLSLQKHEGCRSKTSIGFYDCQHVEVNSTTHEMDETMTVSNTRQNRPKSSYMRRRQYIQTPDSNYEGHTDSNYENPSSYGNRRLRPRSRAGRSAEQRQRNMGIQETDIDTFNTGPPQRNTSLEGTEFHDSRQRKHIRKDQDVNRTQEISCNNKTFVRETNTNLNLALGDLGDDDMHRRKKLVPRETDLDLYISQQTDVDHYQNIARHRKSMCQDTDISTTNSRPPRGDNSQGRHGHKKQDQQSYFPGTVAPRASPNFENRRKERASHHITTTPALLIYRQKTNARNFSGATEDAADKCHYVEETKLPPESRKGTKNKDEKRSVNSQFYRSKTSLQPIESRRPNSESVIIARQRGERKRITTNVSVRPKSDKTLLTSGKTVLSINDSPYQPAQSSPTKIQQHCVLSSSSTAKQKNQKDYKEFNGAHARVMSAKRKIPPQELQLPRQSNMIRDRSQPLTLMKLPPLDATMSKRAERLVVPRETCV